MADDDFAAARAKILSAYAAGEYEAALKLTRAASQAFPHEDARTTYWSACLLARLHHQGAALETLEVAMRRGLWWAPQTLESDPDFEALRDTERFQTIINVSRRAQTEVAARPPRDPVMRSPSIDVPRGILVVLHGRGQTVDDVMGPWSTATDMLLAVPYATQPFDPQTGCWDDARRAEEDVRHAAKSATTAARAPRLPFVVAGFSQGAGLALYLTARRRLPGVVGCIAVAPTAAWSRELIGPGSLSVGDLRFALLAGSIDPRVDECQRLAKHLQSAGAEVRIEIVEGLGHDYPAGFGGWLPGAIDWVLTTDLRISRSPAGRV